MAGTNLPHQAAETIAGKMSENLLQHHLYSFIHHDLESLISDYTDESVLVTPDGTFRGISGIKAFFATLLNHFPKQLSHIQLDKMVSNNELLLIIWHATTPSLEVSFATDTFIMKEGKIYQQTFAGMLKFLDKI